MNAIMPESQSSNVSPGAILVVDDNELNRDLLSRRLIKRGFEVSLAEDGFRALEWLDKNPCDLVLLDIMMPGMSGIEVLEKIRETRDGTELPVIMATARDTRDDIVGALRSGANDYVTKPIDFPVVLARVKTQLKLKHANDRIRSLVSEVECRNVFMRKVFGRYLTDDVVATLLDSPEGLKLGGERREITILMADIRGFTAISAHRDAEEVVTLVNNFLGSMTEVINRHGGTIDEFIGDAILALFGAPRPLHGHAEKAVSCALEMQQTMAEVNAKNVAAGLPEIATGIGINTGEVIVGNIGSETRAKYGVVGHNVNLAARLESQAGGGEVIISDRTLESCNGLVEVRNSIAVQLKGVDEKVNIHDIVAIAGEHKRRLPG